VIGNVKKKTPQMRYWH